MSDLLERQPRRLRRLRREWQRRQRAGVMDWGLLLLAGLLLGYGLARGLQRILGWGGVF